MIPITTPLGIFNVWTKRIGNNPALKVLLLHGGPGATHDYFEAFDSFFPAAGVEYYYYDQLGSGRSDNPADARMWDVSRFVDEVEQLRRALDLGPDNFVLLGQSWGGILAMDFANPRYDELLYRSYYVDHTLRMDPEEWPEPVKFSFANLNYDLYLTMQGPSELGMSDDASLANWDRTNDLHRISAPTLVLGGRHDTMDPTFLEMMATRLPRGSSYICENGSHLAMYDDQEAYFAALLGFLSSL